MALNWAVNLSLIFTEVPLLERFAQAKACGFDAVEIQFPYEEAAEDLKAAADAADVEIILFNIPAGDLMGGGEGLAAVPEMRSTFEQALEQAIAYGRVLKPRWINLLSGRNKNKSQSSLYYETLVGNVAKTLERFSHEDFDLVVEAINNKDMEDFIICQFADLSQLKKQPGCEGIKFQYDIYHMARMNEPVVEQLTSHIDFIGHIQFADCPGRHEPGTGSFHLDEIFQLINSLPYQGWCAAEYNPSCPSEESFDWLNDHTGDQE